MWLSTLLVLMLAPACAFHAHDIAVPGVTFCNALRSPIVGKVEVDALCFMHTLLLLALHLVGLPGLHVATRCGAIFGKVGELQWVSL